MKQIYYFVCFASLLLYSSTGYAQRGKNGPLTVSSTIEVNEYTTLSANAPAGSTSLTVTASSLNSHGRFSKNLSEGDLIMIIQMQGASILSGIEDSTWGNITTYNNCGNYEVREVLSVPDNSTIKLTCPLTNDYTSAGHVQVVRIPRYSALTVNTNGVINCDAWNGQTGGIIAIEVLGATTINGAIDASSSGFRGGQLINTSCCFTESTFATPSINDGDKGEGIAGYQSDYNVDGGEYGRGAPANGGGGGDGWNAAGGGGGNGGNMSGYNSNGNPDTSNSAWVAAWNLEYPGFAKNVSSGGGRGGYTYAVCGPDPYTVPLDNAAWGGDNRRNVGGKGGRPLDYSTGRLFIGGGGGAGHEDNNSGAAGANGGGLVYLVTYSTVNGSGKIQSNGADGAVAAQSYLGDPEDGPGGGGGGGTIIVNAVNAISGINLIANGGIGGSQSVGDNPLNECEGGGGGGSGGYIAISNVGVAASFSGGLNGNTNASGMTAFPSDGGTKGGPGDTSHITNFVIHAPNDTICDNTRATLTATLVGTVPPGETINWYDSITGGNLLGSGATFTTPVLTHTTVFYVGTCPGDYRQGDTVFVRVVSLHIAASNDSICKGDTALLTVSGGTTYLWSNGKTTSSIKVAPVVTTTYSVTIGSQGCGYDTSITVNIRPVLTGTVAAIPDTVCPHGLAVLVVSGGNGTVSYKWSSGGTYDTLNARPSVNTTYTVTIYGKCDTITKTIPVYISPLVMPTISGDSSKCKGYVDTLAASGASSYLWENGSTASKYLTGAIETDTTIVLIGFNAHGCPDTATFNINIAPSPNVTLVDTNTCLNNPITIHAVVIGKDSNTDSYKWSPGGETGNSITVPDTGQTYIVNVSNGCITTQKVNLTPVIAILAACCDKVILLGDDTVMVAHGLTPGEITSYKWSPSVTCLDPLCDSVEASPKVTTEYTVTGTDSLGCETERVIIIAVETACNDFIVPNVFTPSEKGILGLDNVFYIRTENMSAWDITIYDRWGIEMYKSTNPAAYWPGTTEGGGEAPAGVYYYVINSICENNTYKKDGFVQLIR